jgi:DNA-binding transcriptional ArsR family regulator
MELALRAIAEPRRRDILLLIQDGEMAAGEIATHFAVTRPAVSQHLAVLLAAGLITVRKQGTQRIYQSRPQGLAEVREFLERFWDDRLLMLGQEAEAEERRSAIGNSNRQ